MDKVKVISKSEDLIQLNRLLATSAMNIAIKNQLIERIRDELFRIKDEKNAKSIQESLNGLLSEIDQVLRQQRLWSEFEPHFEKIHQDFLQRLRHQYPELTNQDERLCAYLRIELTSKEIAEMMGISVRGVEVARYRLRKRLNLGTKDNLSTFIVSF